MKKEYVKPQIEDIECECEGVIASSCEDFTNRSWGSANSVPGYESSSIMPENMTTNV